MKKRIVCFVLTLIMLISLVPASALSANAASYAVSESAITVLKRLQKSVYTTQCGGSSLGDGYIGYGTKCPNCLGEVEDVAACSVKAYSVNEKGADKLLRAELAELDKAVNTFTGKYGLSVSQGQHDAMVLFSFQNGTAWTYGTGEFQTAIKSGYTGSRFLDAICKWNPDTSDDTRRMIEANMYLNGVYSQYAPTSFIDVTFDVNSATASMKESGLQYFDVATPVTVSLVPNNTDKNAVFQGWYKVNDDGEYERVTTLKAANDGDALIALWHADDADPGKDEFNNDVNIKYSIAKSSLIATTVYDEPNGTKVTTYINAEDKEVTIKLGDVLYVTNDYIDSKGVHWAKIADRVVNDDDSVEYYEMGWVKVKTSGSSAGTGVTMDVNVTVTNTYVNMRKNASITSAKCGSFNYGDVLRIIDTKNGGDGFLWGQVATSADDATPIGWVALMYTDYNTVIANTNNAATNASVIGTATIWYNGYVNVRSEAGVNNQIVGALSQGVTVDLYETKYVNGIQWGRCSTGWFCLTYANVTGQTGSNSNISNEGFANYVFSGAYTEWTEGCLPSANFLQKPNGVAVEPDYKKDAKGNFILTDAGEKIEIPMASDDVTFSNLVEDENGVDWCKTNYGWIELDKIEMDEAEFYVIADTATVRNNPANGADRMDLLVQGTAFNIITLDIQKETIWGMTNCIDGVDLEYNGWVNLSNSNVSRNGAPSVSIGGSGSTESTTVKMAKVVGTESLRVRITGATYGKQIGSLAYGTTAKILEEKNGWYNLDIDVDGDPSTGSWVSGTYLDIYEETIGGTSSGSASSGTTTGAVETGLGMVANTYTGVNIRTAPGTGNALVGKYLTGTTVEILEVKTHGTAKWGRTEKGWVCMDYIVMVDKYETGLNGGSGSSSSSTSSEVAIYTGYTKNALTIYKDMSTYVDKEAESVEPAGHTVREVNQGYPLTLHEIIVKEEFVDEKPDNSAEGGKLTTVKYTSYWARVNEGYIYAPEANIALESLDEHVYTVGVTDADVYYEPNGSTVKYDMDKGDTCRVTSLEIYDSTVWGKVEGDGVNEYGWTKMSNMTKGFASSVETEKEEEKEETTATEPTAPSTVIGSTGNTTGGYVGGSGYKYTGKVINTNQVNVRATASTTANVTTTLKSGAALVIYETVISEAMAWGRCDSGWVYLYYVDLTPVGSGAVDARVVYNDNTIIYKDMNMSEATGSTYAKMAVVDIYEIVGKMARTELGWIHMDNLL